MADEKVEDKKIPKKPDAAASNGQPEQQKKKKKKNAPDRPQPAWLFPPDEENPVLNPKAKPEKQVQKETKERLEAIDFLNHKAASAPMTDAPPSELLSLVGAFLTSFGFNSTCRIFTQEWQAKGKILDSYNAEDVGKKIPKDTPGLLKIYKKWRLEQGPAKAAEEPSSSEDSEENEPAKPRRGKSKDEPLDDSSSSSSSSDSDDAMSLDGKPSGKATKGKQAPGIGANGMKKTVSIKGEPQDSDDSSEADSSGDDWKLKARAKPTHQAAKSKNPTSKAAANSDSSPTKSSSDSDANDDKETEVPQKKSKKGATDSVPKNNLKRNASHGTHETEITPGAGNSKVKIPAPSTEPPSKKTKGEKPADPVKKDEERPKKKAKFQKNTAAADRTEDGGEKIPNGVEKAAESVDKAEPKHKPTKKAKKDSPPALSQDALPAPSKDEPEKPKREKKKPNAPFQRISSDTKVDPKYASNAYVPNDYSERAHQDLSITKGRGFIKEKNKKKRGS